LEKAAQPVIITAEGGPVCYPRKMGRERPWEPEGNILFSVNKVK